MKVLKGILSESKEYYLDIKKKIEGKLEKLPCGSIKKRKISGKKYYYLQYRGISGYFYYGHIRWPFFSG